MRHAIIIAAIAVGSAWAESGEPARDDCPRPRKERAVELVELHRAKGALPKDKWVRFHLENAEEKLCGPQAERDVNAALRALSLATTKLALDCKRPLVLRYGKSGEDLRRAIRQAKEATVRTDKFLAPVVLCLSPAETPTEPARIWCGITSHCYPDGPF